ncbi:CPK19 [Symbiodinium microadriaticum]|nr:CPK19 [Symbiodinium microadriaticum]
MSRRKTDGDSRMLDIGEFPVCCTSSETGKIVRRRRQAKGGTLHQYMTARRPSQPECLPQIPSPRVEKEPLQRHTSLPAIVDVKTEALLLSRQLHLDFHEVKHAVQELRKEHAELANGGMELATFRDCVLRAFSVKAINDRLLQDAYRQCKAADGPVSPKRFLAWYRDHIFIFMHDQENDPAKESADALTLELAKKHDCSCIELDKVKLQFDHFDTDKSGLIEHNEFESMMYTLLHCANKSDLPPNRIERFWHEVDLDGNGSVDFTEFTEWYLKYFALAQEHGPIEAFYDDAFTVLRPLAQPKKLEPLRCREEVRLGAIFPAISIGGRATGNFASEGSLKMFTFSILFIAFLFYRTCAKRPGKEEEEEDLQLLSWRDCEGSGPSRQIPLSKIVAVEDASLSSLPGASNGEGHHALQVKLRQEKGSAAPAQIELICTSKEDLEAWLHGLRFLVADQGGEVAKAPQGKSSEQGLQEKLRLQEQLCEQLRQENSMLRDIVKRKDETISELLRDSQSKSIKTESTSRESDEHLQYREVAILRRKNKRLQLDLKSKQQTIAGLLKLVERLSQQADAETSAPEEDTQDEPEINPKVVDPKSPKIQVTQVAVDPEEPRTADAPVVQAPCPSPLDPAPTPTQLQEGPFAGELVALVEKLQALQEATLTATQGVASLGSFQPPSRSAAAGAQGAQAAQAAQAPAPAAAGRGPKSAAALEALQRELALLEEKKRVVQHLAHTLEPDGSDSEEGDGFPLR